ncbi:Transcription factor SOX-17 [Batrachochytrium dendrobatidis]
MQPFGDYIIDACTPQRRSPNNFEQFCYSSFMPMTPQTPNTPASANTTICTLSIFFIPEQFGKRIKNSEHLPRSCNDDSSIVNLRKNDQEACKGATTIVSSTVRREQNKVLSSHGSSAIKSITTSVDPSLSNISYQQREVPDFKKSRGKRGPYAKTRNKKLETPINSVTQPKAIAPALVKKSVKIPQVRDSNISPLTCEDQQNATRLYDDVFTPTLTKTVESDHHSRFTAFCNTIEKARLELFAPVVQSAALRQKGFISAISSTNTAHTTRAGSTSTSTSTASTSIVSALPLPDWGIQQLNTSTNSTNKLFDSSLMELFDGLASLPQLNDSTFKQLNDIEFPTVNPSTLFSLSNATCGLTHSTGSEYDLHIPSTPTPQSTMNLDSSLIGYDQPRIEQPTIDDVSQPKRLKYDSLDGVPNCLLHTPLNTPSLKSRKPRSVYDDGCIARPLNAFLLFRRDHHKEIRALNPTVTFGELSKLIGRAWRSQNDTTRTRYHELAVEVQKQHQNLYPGFKFIRRPTRAIRKRAVNK